MTTSDSAFKRGSQHLLSGVFSFYYKNGRLSNEYVFDQGYILSFKSYQWDGSLAIWYDYDIDFDGCLFSCLVQMCWKEKGIELTDELIITYIDGRPRFLKPEFAQAAKRRGWIMK